MPRYSSSKSRLACRLYGRHGHFKNRSWVLIMGSVNSSKRYSSSVMSMRSCSCTCWVFPIAASVRFFFSLWRRAVPIVAYSVEKGDWVCRIGGV